MRISPISWVGAYSVLRNGMRHELDFSSKFIIPQWRPYLIQNGFALIRSPEAVAVKRYSARGNVR